MREGSKTPKVSQPSLTHRGQPLERNNFRRDVWKPLIDTITWLPRGLRFHDLRHTHISILLDLGTPVGDVAQRAGHASTKMTQDRYGHAMPHHDDRALSRLAHAKAARLNNAPSTDARQPPALLDPGLPPEEFISR